MMSQNVIISPIQIFYIYNLLQQTFHMGKIIENYALQETIGEGMYGKVYKAVHLKTKDEFAVKVIPIKKFQQNPKLQECTVNEINILSTIQQSPYIVRYVEMLKTPNNFYFIYEYCNGRTLESLLKQENKLQENKALKIFKQLIEAFKVLNKYNIMHRDLKPDNIFFHNGNLKLGDFGFCKTLNKANDMASTMLGSPIYMAPEVLKGEIYTSKADIWSLGVVLYEMLFGFCPFESNSIAKLISVLADTQLRLPLEVNNISMGTQNLLKKLLVKDQFKRIDWLELLQYVITEEGEIYEKKQGSRLDELNLISSQRQMNNTSVSVNKYEHPTYTDYTANFSKKNTEAIFSGSGSKSNNTSISVSSQGSGNSANNTSINRKAIPKPSQYNEPQKQINTSISHSNSNGNSSNNIYEFNPSMTPKKSNSYQEPPTNNIVQYNPSQFKRTATQGQSVQAKRKRLVQEHSFCVNGIRTAVALMKADDPNASIYAYMIFSKVEERLKKITNDINIGEYQLDDINTIISNELKLVERQVIEFKDELVLQSVADLNELSDFKSFLKSRFRDKNEPNLKQYYDMVVFLAGNNKTAMGSKDLSALELTIGINNCLI